MTEFRVEGKGTKAEGLVASEKLSGADFDAIAAAFGRKIQRARKVSMVAARVAREVETIKTEWGTENTTNTAQPGDWIVTNYKLAVNGSAPKPLLDDQSRLNTYVIKPDVFTQRYKRGLGETPNGPLFVAKDGILVDAIYVGRLDIVAPWGERQQIGAAYLLRGGANDIYGNAKSSFDATYEILP